MIKTILIEYNFEDQFINYCQLSYFGVERSNLSLLIEYLLISHMRFIVSFSQYFICDKIFKKKFQKIFSIKKHYKKKLIKYLIYYKSERKEMLTLS
jgi:hypothetical protein